MDPLFVPEELFPCRPVLRHQQRRDLLRERLKLAIQRLACPEAHRVFETFVMWRNHVLHILVVNCAGHLAGTGRPFFRFLMPKAIKERHVIPPK
jgi:hypothetical protein